MDVCCAVVFQTNEQTSIEIHNIEFVLYCTYGTFYCSVAFLCSTCQWQYCDCTDDDLFVLAFIALPVFMLQEMITPIFRANREQHVIMMMFSCSDGDDDDNNDDDDDEKVEARTYCCCYCCCVGTVRHIISFLLQKKTTTDDGE